MPDEFIYETIVYCGRLKMFRILNLNSGTIYSMEYETEGEARNNIIDGEIRLGKPVKFIALSTLRGKI